MVFILQAEASGKSQMAIDKMVEGRLRKYFEEVVLMDQKFIVNDTMNVKVCEVSLNWSGFIYEKIEIMMAILIGEWK